MAATGAGKYQVFIQKMESLVELKRTNKIDWSHRIDISGTEFIVQPLYRAD